MDPEELILEAGEQMDKAVEHTAHEFGSLHTGKASPSMVEGILVEVASYGTTMPIREIAAVNTPDSRSIQIQPWDKNTLKDIEKAIQASNIGLNPSIQGNLIRVPVPELSGERRRDLTKVANRMAEDGRVSVRAARRQCLDVLKKLEKDSTISEDDLARFEKEVQEMTDAHVEKINKAFEQKEKDLNTI